MSKQRQKAEGRRQNNPDAECGLRNGENRRAGIRDNGLECRALRQLRRDREVRQILESEYDVTARREPGSTFLRRGEQSGPQAGKVTARQEPRPTGRAPVLRSSLAKEGGKPPLSPIQSSVTVSLGQTSWADKVGGPAAGLFRCKIKCITVIHLKRGGDVTTCDFHDALLERWTGGNTTQYIQPQTITSNYVVPRCFQWNRQPG